MAAPTTATAPSTAEPSRFLALPTELRLQIYSHLFNLRKPNGFPHLTILRTCRGIYHEASELLYKEHDLTIEIGHSLNPDWSALGAPRCRTMFKRFRRIVLEFCPSENPRRDEMREICFIFNASRWGEERQEMGEAEHKVNWPEVELYESWKAKKHKCIERSGGCKGVVNVSQRLRDLEFMRGVWDWIERKS